VQFVYLCIGLKSIAFIGVFFAQSLCVSKNSPHEFFFFFLSFFRGEQQKKQQETMKSVVVSMLALTATATATATVKRGSGSGTVRVSGSGSGSVRGSVRGSGSGVTPNNYCGPLSPTGPPDGFPIPPVDPGTGLTLRAVYAMVRHGDRVTSK
jgi:hypothetical protein